jgi:DNA-binding NtrC family response regulator
MWIMESKKFELFIVDDDQVMAKSLEEHIFKKFGNLFNVSVFNSGALALQKINASTEMVILDYELKGENGNEVLKAIKFKNPKTEVVMLTSNEDISVALESFRKGATDYVIKNDRAWRKITSIIFKVILYPVNFIVREFGVNKYLAIFLMVFLTMGFLVFYIMKFT